MMDTRTRMYIYIRTCMHAYIHTYLRTYITLHCIALHYITLPLHYITLPHITYIHT